MKKVILCTLGLFPFLAILYLYLSSPLKSTSNVPDNKTSSTYASPTPPTNSSPPPSLTPLHPVPAQLTGQALTGQALTDKLNEGMAKLASQHTPELQRESLRVRMKMRGSMYQEMFDSWNLDPSAAEDVLTVIRERENAYMDASQQLNKTGMSGLKEWRASRDASKAWADTQLLLLLNEDQARQLAEEESSFNYTAAQKGLKIANDILNRPK